MLLQLKNRNGQKGFTLVELLIVVAIIGVLSTIGVPTFRRMIQKSKKSEAKVNLGGIYSAQAAFQSEYNSYGNNLARMGYEMEGALAVGAAGVVGTNRTAIYRVGFMTNACVDVIAAVADIRPTAAGPLGVITSSFPVYYTIANAFGAAGRSQLAVAAAGPLPAVPAMAACFPAAGVIPANPGPAGSTGVGANLANVATDGLSFTAVASGEIMSDRIVSATDVGKDVWTITQTRTLNNVQDGIR